MKTLLGGLGNVTDMNTTVIAIEVECLWFAFAEGERCCCSGGVDQRYKQSGTRALLLPGNVYINYWLSVLLI